MLVVSEELDELFEICDRLVVIAQGRVSPSVPTAQATIETIGEWMTRPVDDRRCAARRRRPMLKLEARPRAVAS